MIDAGLKFYMCWHLTLRMVPCCLCIITFPFCRWRNDGMETLVNLPKTTQLVNGRVWIMKLSTTSAKSMNWMVNDLDICSLFKSENIEQVKYVMHDIILFLLKVVCIKKDYLWEVGLWEIIFICYKYLEMYYFPESHHYLNKRKHTLLCSIVNEFSLLVCKRTENYCY